MHLVPSMSATRNSPNASSDIQDHADHADRPSREEAEAAVRVLIRWAGDNPAREGLIDTPSRVILSYVQFFAGYTQNPATFWRARFPNCRGTTR
jgi:GTP cyclohydrolase IA